MKNLAPTSESVKDLKVLKQIVKKKKKKSQDQLGIAADLSSLRLVRGLRQQLVIEQIYSSLSDPSGQETGVRVQEVEKLRHRCVASLH